MLPFYWSAKIGSEVKLPKKTLIFSELIELKRWKPI